MAKEYTVAVVLNSGQELGGGKVYASDEANAQTIVGSLIADAHASSAMLSAKSGENYALFDPVNISHILFTLKRDSRDQRVSDRGNVIHEEMTKTGDERTADADLSLKIIPTQPAFSSTRRKTG